MCQPLATVLLLLPAFFFVVVSFRVSFVIVALLMISCDHPCGQSVHLPDSLSLAFFPISASAAPRLVALCYHIHNIPITYFYSIYLKCLSKVSSLSSTSFLSPSECIYLGTRWQRRSNINSSTSTNLSPTNQSPMLIYSST